jgi:thioredoxin-like negative regulator of GroEL
MGIFSRLFGPREPPPLPVHVDDANYGDEVLGSELPVMLDVWGPGCVPCKHLEPIVIRLAGRYRGRVKVAEMNAAGAPRSVSRLGVQGTPTVVFLKGRREVERVVGFRGEIYLEEIIESELLGNPPDPA